MTPELGRYAPGRLEGVVVLAALVAGASVGCHRAASTSSAVERPDLATAEGAAPAGWERPCTGGARRTEAAFAAWSGASGRAATGPAFTALRTATACRDDDQGGWFLSVIALRGPPEALRGVWSLGYAAPPRDGLPPAASTTATFTPSTTSPLGGDGAEEAASDDNFTWSNTLHVVPAIVTAFDYDGDGQREAAVVVLSTLLAESGTAHEARRGRVWAYGPGGIEVYGGARGFAIEGAVDVDHDGRPDLTTRGAFAELTTNACSSGEDYPLTGPLLLAHALPDGSFSLGDGVATAFARRDCPNRPRAVMVPAASRPGFVDQGASARAVVCARLWGAPSEPIARAAAEACVPRGACSACDDEAVLARWGRVPTPFVFAPTP